MCINSHKCYQGGINRILCFFLIYIFKYLTKSLFDFIVSIKMSRNHGKVIFNDNWLEDKSFKIWLNKSKDKHKAVCRVSTKCMY